MLKDDILIFGGSGSPKLTHKICEYLDVQPGAREVIRFSEGNLFVRVQENVRGRRVYLVQSTVFPANDHFMELLFWIDALRRASAESVTVVMSYSRVMKIPVLDCTASQDIETNRPPSSRRKGRLQSSRRLSTVQPRRDTLRHSQCSTCYVVQDSES